MTNASGSQRPRIWRSQNLVTIAGTTLVLGLSGEMYTLDFPLIVNHLSHHSPIALSVLNALVFLPNVLFAMFIGVIVDRSSKRRIFTNVSLARAALLMTIFAMLTFMPRSWWVVFASVFILSTLSYAFYNTRFAIIKLAFPDDLTEANGAVSAMEQIVSIGGPVLAGVILTIFPYRDGIFLAAVAAAIGFILVRHWRFPEPPPRETARSVRKELADGWSILRANRGLWSLTVLVMFTNAFEGMFATMTVYFVKDSLGLGNSLLGLALAATSCGAFVGSLLVGSVRKALGLGRMFGLSIAGASIAYFVMSLAHAITFVVISTFLEGLALTVFSIGVWTLRQETTPNELMGRVTGITGSLFKALMPIAVVLSGVLTSAIGVKDVFLMCGLGQLFVALYYRFSFLWTLESKVRPSV